MSESDGGVLSGVGDDVRVEVGDGVTGNVGSESHGNTLAAGPHLGNQLPHGVIACQINFNSPGSALYGL